MATVSDAPEDESIADSIKVTDPLLYIYTSGTTGLPKVADTKIYLQCTFCYLALISEDLLA